MGRWDLSPLQKRRSQQQQGKQSLLHCQLAKALHRTELIQSRQTSASLFSRRSHNVLRVETAAEGERRVVCKAPQVFYFTLLSLCSQTAVLRIDHMDPPWQTKGR